MGANPVPDTNVIRNSRTDTNKMVGVRILLYDVIFVGQMTCRYKYIDRYMVLLAYTRADTSPTVL